MVVTGGRFVIGPPPTESNANPLASITYCWAPAGHERTITYCGAPAGYERTISNYTLHSSIGPLRTHSYVIGLRVPGSSLGWDFRTTDLDAISDDRDPCGGSLYLNATSRNRQRVLR